MSQPSCLFCFVLCLCFVFVLFRDFYCYELHDFVTQPNNHNHFNQSYLRVFFIFFFFFSFCCVCFLFCFFLLVCGAFFLGRHLLIFVFVQFYLFLFVWLFCMIVYLLIAESCSMSLFLVQCPCSLFNVLGSF